MSNPGAPDATDDMTAPPTDDIAPPTDDNAPPADEGDEAAGPQVIATIQYDKDKNEFTLIEGDEPEPEEAATPESGAAATPAGQTFTSVGPLMKAVLDCVKNAESGGSEEDQFNEGFNAEKEPTLKAG